MDCPAAAPSAKSCVGPVRGVGKSEDCPAAAPSLTDTRAGTKCGDFAARCELTVVAGRMHYIVNAFAPRIRFHAARCELTVVAGRVHYIVNTFESRIYSCGARCELTVVAGNAHYIVNAFASSIHFCAWFDKVGVRRTLRTSSRGEGASQAERSPDRRPSGAPGRPVSFNHLTRSRGRGARRCRRNRRCRSHSSSASSFASLGSACLLHGWLEPEEWKLECRWRA